MLITLAGDGRHKISLEKHLFRRRDVDLKLGIKWPLVSCVGKTGDKACYRLGGCADVYPGDLAEIRCNGVPDSAPDTVSW